MPSLKRKNPVNAFVDNEHLIGAQNEGIRFMNQCVQSTLDKYPNNSEIQRLATNYHDVESTQPAKAKALLIFEKESASHIEQEKLWTSGIGLGYETSNFASQVAHLNKNKNKSLERIATGVGAACKAIEGIRKIQQASSTMANVMTSSTHAMSSISNTTINTASSSANMLSTSTSLLSGFGLVLSAFSLVTSLFGDDDDEDNGLGEALQAIHSTILDMWQDTRENFKITWEKLDFLDKKLDWMELQNRKRFLMLLDVMNYYGETISTQLNQLHTTIHAHLDYNYQRLEARIDNLIDETVDLTIGTIDLDGRDKTIQKLSETTEKLARGLTKNAAVRSGKLQRLHGTLRSDPTTLISGLQDAIAPETSHALPLGLFASLAHDLEPAIIEPNDISQMINTQGWMSVLQEYKKVLHWGLATIEEENTQSAYLKQVQSIKQAPLVVLDFLSGLRNSEQLWEKLVKDYLYSLQVIQSEIRTTLEEKRIALNVEYDIDPDLKLLSFAQSAEENATRIASDSTLKNTLIGQYEPSDFLRKQGPRAPYLVRKMLDNETFNTRFMSIIHAPYFFIAHKLKLMDMKVTYKHSQPSVIQESHHMHALLRNEGSKTFYYHSDDIRCDLTLGNKIYALHQFNFYIWSQGTYPDALWFNFNGRLPSAQSKSYEEYKNCSKQQVYDLIDGLILQPKRQAIAREISNKVDFKSFECARLKLLSFMQLLNPNFTIHLNSSDKVIKQHLRTMMSSGHVGSLRTLLSPSFGADLLSADLGLKTVASKDKLISTAKKIVKDYPLQELSIWQTMAYAYASIGELEYRLMQIELNNNRPKDEEYEQQVYQGMSLLAEHHQRLADFIQNGKSAIEQAQLLVETHALSNEQYQSSIEQWDQLETQFDYMIGETNQLNNELETEYVEPSIKPSNDSVPSKKTFLDQQWDKETQKLGFSVEETVQLLRATYQNFQSIKIRKKSAVLMLGSTGDGKSTLTNATLGIKYKKENRKACLVNSSVQEYARTGKTRASETQIPNFCTTDTTPYYIIDTAGLEDTRGMPQKIANACCFEWIKHEVEQIKGIILTCAAQDMLDTRYEKLRKNLAALGNIIKDIPEEQAQKQICFVVTQSTHLTREEIYNDLVAWEKDAEFNNPTSNEQQTIKRALRLLIHDMSSILLIDVTEPDAHLPLLEKINDMPEHPISKFSFVSSSIEMGLVRQMIKVILNEQNRLSKDVQQLKISLAQQLNMQLLKHNIDLSVELQTLKKELERSASNKTTFELLQKFLDKVNMSQEIIEYAMIARGSLSHLLHSEETPFFNTSTVIAEELREKNTYLKNNRDFFNLIAEINKRLNAAHFVNPHQTAVNNYEIDGTTNVDSHDRPNSNVSLGLSNLSFLSRTHVKEGHIMFISQKIDRNESLLNDEFRR